MGPVLRSRLRSTTDSAIDGFAFEAQHPAIGNDWASALHVLPPLTPQKQLTNDANYPENQNGAEADRSYSEPPNQSQTIVHSVGLPCSTQDNVTDVVSHEG
jgi:hypothetical protein